MPKLFNSVICLICLLSPSGQAEALPKTLILTGNGNANFSVKHYPPWVHEFHNEILIDTIKDITAVHVTSNVSDLNEKNLAQYDLVINNSIFHQSTPDQMAALRQFVEGGKSYLTLHMGILSLLGDAQRDLMGGYYLGGPSTVPEEFNVIPHDEWVGYDYRWSSQEAHPIGRGMKPFRMRDELYAIHFVSPRVQVIARAENQPVMWLNPHGRGAAMALTIGHGAEARQVAGYRALLRNGVSWLTKGPILNPVQDIVFRNDMPPLEPVLNLASLAHHPVGRPMSFAVTTDAPNVVKPRIGKDNRLHLSFPANATGKTRVTVTATDDAGRVASTAFAVEVARPVGRNLALFHGVKATVSSSEARRVTADPDHARDGDPLTGWSSDFSDPQWFLLDLGKATTIDRVRLLWEGARAVSYDLEASGDGSQWRKVHSTDAGKGSVDHVDFDPVKARFVRVTGKVRALPRWGYSMHEFEVYAAK